ncbi:TonB-dependent siderophore receptor [Robertkochia solimangrovi]|uniref:TonB-dependent siderophore receptor n=1 Tax=Robertkochia solimangrovi TaxID=2213046 RepID=UPI00117F6301|nr:TonB-dependent siderophore receptor [Robertkochia solimangrovi]TRZ42055.1 TonB-dependent siderophore receptor [Robertkochia solimangrovi]
MIKQLTLTLFLMITLIGYSQNGSIKGKVTSENGQPISNVTVRITEITAGTVTDNRGEYQINTIKPGTYTLVFSYIGFYKQEKSVTVSSGITTSLPTVILKESEESLEEVVVSTDKNKYSNNEPSNSLRLNTSLMETPQNIQILSKALLEDQQTLSIMENVTRNVSGAQMIEHWGHFARINMRGFRIPAFRNGMNVEMTWGPLAEDMSMVERIEFVKGPAGFMMAAGQPGGFYNVVTKKPTLQNIGEISFTGGSFNTYRGTVDYAGHTNNGKFQYRINGMLQSEESFRDFEKSQRYSIVPSLKYEFTDRTSLTTEFTYQSADMPIGAAYVFAPSSAGYGSLDRDFTSIDNNYPNTDIEEYSLLSILRHEFNDNWSVQAQYTMFRYDQEGFSPWPWSVEENGDIIRGVSIWDALGDMNLAQVFVNGKFNTGSISHKVLGGFDYNEKEYWADWAQGGAIDATDDPFNIYNPVYGKAVMPEVDRSQDIKVRGEGGHQGLINRGLYVQDEIGFLQDKIRLTLAGRYTDADIYAYGSGAKADKFTPRIGISADILPTLTVYGLYDESFYPQYGISATGQSFDPEESDDIEGGIKKTWFEGKLNTSFTVYQITKNNLLVSDPENINFSIQLGQVQSKGVEFDMQGQITPEFNVVLNYANTNVEITEDTNPDNIGNRVAGHAKHITNGWFNYNFNENTALKGFGISLGYQYQIDRSSWNWGAENESELPDYFRLDGALTWKSKKFDVRLNVNNILDEYLYSGSNYGSYLYWQAEPGINGRISVTYRFL